MLEQRCNSAEGMLKKLEKEPNIENADFVVYLSENFLNKITKQYENTTGWLDESTKYTVKSVTLQLLNGSAICSMALSADNDKYGVGIDLALDAIVTFEAKDNDLVLGIEPFNISPAANSKGVISIADEMIENLIKIKLAELNKNFPPIKIPLSISDKIVIPGTGLDVNDKINLKINSPERQINYKLRLKDIFIFKEKAVVTLNMEGMEVK
jgi:hypothetical protein